MLSDEEKEAIEWLKRLVKLNKRDNLDDTFAEILLNLIEKQSKEIEEYKKQLDLDNECEIALNSKVMDLEKEIEELKEDSCCMTNCVRRDKEKLFLEDKIKAKIEELEKEEKEVLKGTKGQDRYAIKQEYMHKRSGLQSLLEKE
jgi:hypothetical protein